MAESVHVWLDGEPASSRDLATVAGLAYGHFTAMQIRDGAVRGLVKHLHRIDRSHRELFGEALPEDLVLRRWAQAARHQPDGYLRATFFQTPDAQSHVLVVLRPPLEPPAVAQRLTAITYVRPFPHLKHLGTFGQLHCARLAMRAGFDDALLTTPDGEIAETSIANIGLLRGGEVIWPVAPSLSGIGMQLLAQALPPAGVPSRPLPVAAREIGSFDGAFLVNSIGVAPVASIDDHVFDDPGTAVSKILDVHRDLPWDHL